MQSLSLEVLAQRAMARGVVLQRIVAIRAQGAGQNGNIAKDGLKRLVENIRHLVFEVLRRNQRIEQAEPPLTFPGYDLPARAGDAGVGVEGLPEVIQRVVAGLGPDVEQNAHVGAEGLAKGVEEPAMGIEFLLVFFLEAENNLARHDALLGALEFEIGIQRDLGGVFVHVGRHLARVDQILGDAVLIDAHGGESVQGSGMDFSPPVRDDADDNLLPAVFAPGA